MQIERWLADIVGIESTKIKAEIIYLNFFV